MRPVGGHKCANTAGAVRTVKGVVGRRSVSTAAAEHGVRSAGGLISATICGSELNVKHAVGHKSAPIFAFGATAGCVMVRVSACIKRDDSTALNAADGAMHISVNFVLIIADSMIVKTVAEETFVFITESRTTAGIVAVPVFVCTIEGDKTAGIVVNSAVVVVRSVYTTAD